MSTSLLAARVFDGDVVPLMDGDESSMGTGDDGRDDESRAALKSKKTRWFARKTQKMTNFKMYFDCDWICYQRLLRRHNNTFQFHIKSLKKKHKIKL